MTSGQKNHPILRFDFYVHNLDHPYHPSLSWPQLEIDYVSKGQVVTQDDLDLYVVGNGTKAIIWNYGIHGFNDYYFRGDSLDFRTEPQRSGFNTLIFILFNYFTFYKSLLKSARVF